MRQSNKFNHATNDDDNREMRGVIDRIRTLLKGKKETGSLSHKRQIEVDIKDATKKLTEIRGSANATVKEESVVPDKPMTKEERESFELKKKNMIEELNKKRSV